MKLANIDTLVWLIIAVMVVVAKAWSKSQKQVGDDTSESKDDMPPIVPAQRRAPGREMVRPQLQRPRPQPRRAPPQAGPLAPVMRTAQPSPRPVPRTATGPVGSPVPREGWRIDPEQVRRFVEQLSGQPLQESRGKPPSTSPPPVAPPPVSQRPAPAPPPMPTPATALTETMPKMTDLSAPSTPSRASQWAEALRDRQNIRNIIISAEIIGPPKSL